MNIRNLLTAFLLTNFFSLTALASDNLVSPNGKYSVEITLQSGTPYMLISGRNVKLPLERVRLGLSYQNLSDDVWKLSDVSPVSAHKDDYHMLTGKRSHCINQANIRTYSFSSKDIKMNIEVRAYDNGLAFRYVDADKTAKISDEKTAYFVPDGICRWQQAYDANGYEDFYEKRTDGTAVKNRNRTINQWGYPMLLKSDKGVYALITEANVTRSLCASLLNNKEVSTEYKVERGDVSYNKLMPASSPWRIIMIGSLNDIVESTLVTDVSDPDILDNIDWVKPGPASWVYWANNHGSKDFKIVKDYINLAAKMHWPYVLIDWEWDVMSNGGTVEDAIKYALSLGVKPMLWYNSMTSWTSNGAPGTSRDISKKEFREKEFAWLSGLGVAGVKIDFFKADGSEIMDYYHDLMECAAKNHLLINFHGASVPRGWNRTYPNLMSTEAVYGAEYYNNTPLLTKRAAWHNAMLPFTRNVVGSMDYTPGTFSDTQHPHITSDGHELALSFLFESGLQHMPDRPSVYVSLTKDVQSLLYQLPTAWDDTKFICGEPGESAVIARRKGNTWYIAGINGKDVPQSIDVNISLLGLKEGKMSVYKDKDSEKGLEMITLKKLPGKYTIKCVESGGFVIKID